jgi:hypothetical protein
MRIVGSALAASLAALMVAMAAAVPAHAAACPTRTVDGVRIVELENSLGCDQGGELASATVLDGGWYDDAVYYCRWGQGGTRPIKREGKTFYAGFCLDKATEVEAGFLARPPLRTCRDTRLDDLRARYVDCSTARKVYRRSLRVAQRDGSGSRTTRFRYRGDDWRCRAYNPHKRNWNPAWYEWKCRAPHDVLVHYRWLAGE